VLARIEPALRQRPVHRPAGHRPPVTFFIWNVFAMGGTVRTVLRQASGLAELGHDVTIVSVIRHRAQQEPFFAIDPRIEVRCLVDRHRWDDAHGPRAALVRWLDRRPARSTQFGYGRETQASLLTDWLLLLQVLRTRGVLIGTRMGLNLAIARFGHPEAVLVAQEHLQLRRYPAATRDAMRRHAVHLDVITCCTAAEASDYRDVLRTGSPAVLVLPNTVPAPLPEPSPRANHRIVSVGRLVWGKGFERLIDAFAAIAADHPDWHLRIVGEGPRRDSLQERITTRGLGDRITLARATHDVAGELRDASVFALPSRHEAFGLVLLEAMACGLPTVAFDCPQGPRDLIGDGSGILVPDGDVEAFATELRGLLGAPSRREVLGVAARSHAEEFTTPRVMRRFSAELQRHHAAAEVSQAPTARPLGTRTPLAR
jgi:glycosyltransferase involved in cell wall biosynthesis